MNLNHKKVVVSGATGGIGQSIISQLLKESCNLVLLGRHQDSLEKIQQKFSAHAAQIEIVVLNFNDTQFTTKAKNISHKHNDSDILLNCAGVNLFSAVEDTSPEQVSALLDTNLKSAILLTQAFLPNLKQRPESAIVNIGSTFGSIGYPGFSVYCASKFGLRGFSEALRRELAKTPVKVFHVSPRATLTTMNDATITAMNQELGNAMDSAEQVAQQTLSTIKRNQLRLFIGWPERLFVAINAVLPKLVDNALIKQLPIIQKYLAH